MSTFHWEGAAGVPTEEAEWEILDNIPIDATGLPRVTSLRRRRIYTLAQLLLWSTEEVAEFEGIGSETIKKYLPRLSSWGLRLPTADELAETKGTFWAELGECEQGPLFRTPRHLAGELPLERSHANQALYSVSSQIRGLLATCGLEHVSALVQAISLGQKGPLAEQAATELKIEPLYHHYALSMGLSSLSAAETQQNLVHRYLRDLSIFAEAVNLNAVYPEL